MAMTDAERDLFGQTPTEPDISSEALQWEPDDTFDSARLPSGDEDAVTNPDEPEGGEGEGEDDGADADEDNGEDPAEPADDNAEIPEQFRGKSPAELVKIIQDSQSMVNRQGNEIGELRKAVEAIQSAQQQAAAAEAVPASEYIATEQDGLLAYREAIGMLDRGEIGPAAIDDIIDVVRDLNPVTAAKMDRDFGMRLARAEMHQQMAPVIEQSYNDALRQATMNVNADPDAEAYREDLVRIVQQPASLVEHQVAVAYQQARTAPEIEGALKAALQIARGANPIKSAAFKQDLAKRKQNEQVEGGNASQAQVPKTEAEQIIDGLLNPQTKAADLFAGFGGG